MRRRLAMLVAATTSLVLLAFLLPLAALIHRAAGSNALSTAVSRSESVVPVVASDSDAAAEAAVAELTATGYTVTVLMPDGRRLGAQRGITARVSSDTRRRATTVRDVTGGVLIRQPVFRADGGTAVISTLVPRSLLREGVWRAWTVLTLLGVLLVGLSMGVADRLARSITRPVSDLVRSAERLGRGDLLARVDPGGPQEIRELGLALNRLATRVSELLATERELVADLSHRLRTPVTTLRLDVEGLRDDEERARLGADVDELTRQVNAVIHDARRPVREGMAARCDAVAVVADRVAFWRVLADEQSRPVQLQLPDDPCVVRASEGDLAAAVDALLGNVFAHTPDATGFSVAVRRSPDGGATIVVRDEGNGFSDDRVLGRGESRSGSTGLGLDIVRRTAVAASGDVQIAGADGGGAQVVVRLGPAA